MKYKEIRYVEPASALWQTPCRYRYVVCRVESEQGANIELRMVGGQGSFDFVGGVCSDWLGKYEATIVGDIDQEDYRRADRFENIE